MSEYQYYEFQAIDRPLDERAIEYLRSLSSRASITTTSFVNVYNFGDFKGNPRLLMEKYFDAFVYVANWGDNELMFRFPRDAVDVNTLASYGVGDCLSVRTKGPHVILRFHSKEEGGDWVDGEGWLSNLVPLRSDILQGDIRSLYLGWLACVSNGDLGDTVVEPSIPEALGRLSGALRGLAEFLRIDDTLIEAAALRSKGKERATPPESQIRGWIGSLPEAKKNTLLLELMQHKAPHEIQARLLQQFRGQAKPETGPRSGAGRTVAELLAEAQQLTQRNERKAAKRAEREEERREREEELSREKRLEELAARETAAWSDVERLIATRNNANYAEAVDLLLDLQALAARDKKQKQFESRIAGLRGRHARKYRFFERLDREGLQQPPG